MSSRTTGITLIEVVAALALLASLLVALLAAHDRLGTQTRQAKKRLKAIEAADRLLLQWTAVEPMQIPSAEGEFGKGADALRWQVTTQGERGLEDFGLQVAELRVFSSGQESNEPPLVSVEFLTTSAVGLTVP